MKAVALLWILVFYPPHGDVQILPIGYKTERECNQDGKKKAKLVSAYNKRKTKWSCQPVSEVEPLHLPPKE